MDDYKAMVREAQAQAVTLEVDRDGDLVVADMLVRLADAVEALVGIEQRLTDHIVQLAAERDALAAENEKLRERLSDLRAEHDRQVESYADRIKHTTMNYLSRAQAARDAEAERDALRAQLDKIERREDPLAADEREQLAGIVKHVLDVEVMYDESDWDRIAGAVIEAGFRRAEVTD